MRKSASMIDRALELAGRAHLGQLDKGGNSYILHPLRVMSRLHTRDEELICIALLHDAVEDSEGMVTLHDLEHYFSSRVIVAIDLLTHDPKQDYMDYIRAIATNADATRVKLEDLRDNSDITRLKGLGQKDMDRLAKYAIAHDFLVKWGAH